MRRTNNKEQPQTTQGQPRGRMDALLQEIDKVLSKKQPATSKKTTKGRKHALKNIKNN